MSFTERSFNSVPDYLIFMEKHFKAFLFTCEGGEQDGGVDIVQLWQVHGWVVQARVEYRIVAGGNVVVDSIQPAKMLEELH